METSRSVDDRVEWVVELAREAVEGLIPEHVSLSEADRFDAVVTAWAAGRRRPGRPRAPKVDALARISGGEAEALLLLLAAAEGVQDALRDEAADRTRSGLRRIFRRGQGSGPIPGPAPEPAAEKGAQGAAASPVNGDSAALADPSFTSEQLSRIRARVYRRLLELDQPKQTASLYADVVVGVLVTRSSEDPS